MKQTKQTRINQVNLEGIGAEIDSILRGYVKAESVTESREEKKAEEYFVHYLSKIPYFEKHSEHMGSWPIPDDPFDRAVAYGMVKGKGADTIVLLHHNDVVGVEDFKQLAAYAFSPDELAEKLTEMQESFAPATRADLLSGEYLFGRGVCDMKGGGSIQLALINRYSQLTDFTGNLVVIGVPDEENLSAGMRAGISLLCHLQETYGLRYRLMINSEPHQRRDSKIGVFSEGSVGKLMPFFYIRGYLAHAGKVFEGLNPLNLMSAIVRKTELATEFSDVVGKEAAPPPTWLFLKDGKEQYDVSMPLSISGCLSILTLNRTPQGILDKVREISQAAFSEIITEMNQRYHRFLEVTGQPRQDLPWQVKVVDFAELFDEARASHGSDFEQAYREKKKELEAAAVRKEHSLMEIHSMLVEFLFGYIDDLSPRVVFGLIPPYYPNVCNEFLPLKLKEGAVDGLSGRLAEFTQKTYGQDYEKESFYTGISDLSYTAISHSQEIVKTLQAAMPFFGTAYSLPIRLIEKITMPCINIGPWGKDFHKMTERVLKEDLYERTPHIIDETIRLLLG